MSVSKVFVIAEAGINHQGRLDTAMQLIAAAKAAGADACKFQAFTPSVLAPGNWERQAMLKGLALTRDELIMCAAETRSRGLEFLVTPMDADWLAFCVETLRVKRIKIGSAQAGDAAFVQAVAATRLPVIISNGMAAPSVFAQAVNEWLYDVDDVTVMSCISQYPTDDTMVEMSALAVLRNDFPERKVGFSSHARGFWPSVAAVYAGATVIECHLALEDCTSPDATSSLLPEEFQAMVREIRVAEKMRG